MYSYRLMRRARNPQGIFELPWGRMRNLIKRYAWVEMYPNQKEMLLLLMDSPINLTARVLVYPRTGVIELVCERYFGLSHFINRYGEMIVVAQFDEFMQDCPNADECRN